MNLTLKFKLSGKTNSLQCNCHGNRFNSFRQRVLKWNHRIDRDSKLWDRNNLFIIDCTQRYKYFTVEWDFTFRTSLIHRLLQKMWQQETIFFPKVLIYAPAREIFGTFVPDFSLFWAKFWFIDFIELKFMHLAIFSLFVNGAQRQNVDNSWIKNKKSRLWDGFTDIYVLIY